MWSREKPSEKLPLTRRFKSSLGGKSLKSTSTMNSATSWVGRSEGDDLKPASACAALPFSHAGLL